MSIAVFLHSSRSVAAISACASFSVIFASVARPLTAPCIILAFSAMAGAGTSCSFSIISALCSRLI
jgi:hypothetical protein